MEKMRKEALQTMFTEAMESEEFCVKLLKCADAASVCKLLADNGIVATEEEIAQFKTEGDAVLANYSNRANDELSMEELENVAGGGKARKVLRGALSLTGGAILGFGLGCASAVCPAFAPAAHAIGVSYAVAATAWTSQG